jgi:ribosomal protein L29
MDYFKLTADELRSKDLGELQTASYEVRKSLAQIRMDIYTAPAVNTGKVKKLKKSLARILTVAQEKAKAQA